MYRSWIAAAVLVASTVCSPAQDAADARLRALKKVYGNLSPEELVERVTRDLERVGARAQATDPSRGALRARPEPRSIAAPKPLPNSYINSVLLMRDVYSVVGFLNEGELSDKGASFTHTSDRIASQTNTTGKGALFWALYGDVNTNVPGTIDPSTNRLTYFAFVPGLEWDITAKDGKNAKGMYAARLGTEFEFQGAPISTQYLRANAIYTTDVETSTAKIYGAEFAWEPKISKLNINTRRQINRDLKMMFGFFPTLNFDYFHVGETAKFANLIKRDDYFWVGPKIQGDLSFRKGSPLERFSFIGEYFYLYDLYHGRHSTVDYGRGTANFKLIDWKPEADPSQLATMALTLRFTRGKAPRTLDKVEELYTGISLALGRIPKSSDED
jgi:hypothetical protein